MSRRRRAPRAYLQKLGGTFRLGIVLALLVGVNVYVFFFSSGSLKQVSQAAQAASTRAPVENALVETGPAQAAPTPGAPVAGPPVAPKAKPKRRDGVGVGVGVIREHEGLSAVLRREGLLPKDADATLRALAPILNFRKELRPGLAYSVRLDAGGRLEAFELKVAPGVVCAVGRGPDGKLTAERLATAPRLGHH